ncbi:homeobox protein BEL1 homolog [Curcuma longa]|uniref:homeobox protein BEL1 homolog n=1 Tax=Curcuma longa TaxID=136217 RepID=UPI003D9E030D
MAHDRSTHRQTLGYTDFSSGAGAGAMQGFQSSQELFGLQQAAAAGMDIMGRAFFPPTVAAAAAASSPVPPPPLIMSENNLLFPWPAEPQNRTLLDVESSSSARFLFPAAPPCEPPSMAAPSSSSLSLSLNHALGLTNYSRDNQLLKNSKFLIPARELLNEFCNLKTAGAGGTSKPMAGKSNPHWEEGRRPSTSSNPSNPYTFNIHELQARKAKLMAMLQEVDSRYRRYREQMRALVASFEEVAGEGSAAAYSTLASKVMSRHFRCLRDGIAEQVQAMGEKDDDAVAPGTTTRGETPRLKLIGRCLRQQRALRHPGVMESHPWRPQRGLPERSVAVLRAWLFEHFLHPYPSDVDKHILARQTGLSRSQVSNWFINARVRLWKPMVEEMYKEETKDKEMQTTELEENNENSSHNASRNLMYNDLQVVVMDEEQKPDPDSLSWVISGRDGRGSGKGFRNPSESFGVVDIDFASYGDGNGSGGLMHHGGGVSLTLGLQQHDGGRGGMSLSFSPPTATQIFSREAHMMEEAAQHATTTTTTYRNLMGAHQLLRDLAG